MDLIKRDFFFTPYSAVGAIIANAQRIGYIIYEGDIWRNYGPDVLKELPL